MFDRVLLESSSYETPVLTPRHRIVAMLAGLAGFLATQRLLPMFFAGLSPRTLLVQSLLLGLGLALHVLMLCYVYAEARRLQLGAVRWLALALFTSVAGFMAFLIQSARRTGDWKRATVPIASACEVMLLGVLVLVPLVKTQALGLAELRTQLVFLPSPPPPPVVADVRRRPSKPTPQLVHDSKIIAPNVIPDKVAQVVEEPVGPTSPDIGVISSTGIPDGSRDGVLRSILSSIATGSTPPPIPVQPKAMQPVRVKVGGQVEAAKLIYAPKPEYPPLAKLARIQGTVRLEAVISTDGRIQHLQVLSGHPLLVKAALDGVAQWRYQPTLLNGDPVEVVTEVDVNFTLAE